MVAGDSTAGQLWYSLVVQLKGTFGKNSRAVSGLDEAVASDCNDTVRITFSRNDLLVLNPRYFAFFLRFDGNVKLHPFAEKAGRDADIVLLGTGHHFPSFVNSLSERFGAKMPPNAFFHLNLNSTLAQIVNRRQRYGHHPSSTMLISSVIPVPGCRRFTRPLSLADSLYAQSAAITPEFVGLRLFWDGVLKQNTIAQWLAMEHGVSFLDISALSLMRPDGQMARFSPKNDCLHSCLPGPVDTWIQLGFNLWEGLRDRLRDMAPPTHGARFFASDNQTWIRRRGLAYGFEFCNASATQECWSLAKRAKGLHKELDWLFARRGNHGALNATSATPAFAPVRLTEAPPSPPMPPDVR